MPGEAFELNRAYPAVVTIKGATRRFAVSKASGTGPFRLTALVQGTHGPRLNRYTLSHKGELTQEGQVNLWALAPDVRDERIAEFKAVFEGPAQSADSPSTQTPNCLLRAAAERSPPAAATCR